MDVWAVNDGRRRLARARRSQGTEDLHSLARDLGFAGDKEEIGELLAELSSLGLVACDTEGGSIAVGSGGIRVAPEPGSLREATICWRENIRAFGQGSPCGLMEGQTPLCDTVPCN